MTARHRAMLQMLAFGGSWAAVEMVGASMNRGYSPYQIVWFRYGVHLVFMLAVFGTREPLTLIRTRRPVFQVARSFLMLVMPASWIMAAQRGVGTGTMTAVLASAPLLVIVCGAVFLRERLTNRIWIAAIMASAGYFACALPLSGTSIRYLALPGVTAASLSLYVVMTRSLRTETTRANLFYTALGVFVALSIFIKSIWIMPDPHDIACMVVIGLIGYVALYALDRSAASAPAGLLAPLAACQIPFSMLRNLMLGHARLGAETWAAAGLIGTATLLAFGFAAHGEPAID